MVLILCASLLLTFPLLQIRQLIQLLLQALLLQLQLHLLQALLPQLLLRLLVMLAFWDIKSVLDLQLIKDALLEEMEITGLLLRAAKLDYFALRMEITSIANRLQLLLLFLQLLLLLKVVDLPLHEQQLRDLQLHDLQLHQQELLQLLLLL